jgi:hypothetical protein
MILLLTFATFFVLGQTANLGISVAVEQIYKPAGLAVFFLLFAAVVVGGWRLAVRVTDRLPGTADIGRRPR